MCAAACAALDNILGLNNKFRLFFVKNIFFYEKSFHSARAREFRIIRHYRRLQWDFSIFQHIGLP